MSDCESYLEQRRRREDEIEEEKKVSVQHKPLVIASNSTDVHSSVFSANFVASLRQPAFLEARRRISSKISFQLRHKNKQQNRQYLSLSGQNGQLQQADTTRRSVG